MGRPKNSVNGSVRLKIEHGHRFGNLTVLHEGERLRLPSGQVNRTLICRCDCGKEKQIRLCHLAKGRIRSCGCFNGEDHGSCNTKLYHVWHNLRDRCYRFKNLRYKDYGAKGIKVAEEWRHSFIAFKEWSMKNGYKEGLQIDRINNKGNYEPSNCRWATRIQNANNTSMTVLVTYKGQQRPLMELVRDMGIENKVDVLRYRIRTGWDHTEAIETPVTQGNYRRRATHGAAR